MVKRERVASDKRIYVSTIPPTHSFIHYTNYKHVYVLCKYNFIYYIKV